MRSGDWVGYANITTTSRCLSTTRVRLQRARALFEAHRSGEAGSDDVQGVSEKHLHLYVDRSRTL